MEEVYTVGDQIMLGLHLNRMEVWSEMVDTWGRRRAARKLLKMCRTAPAYELKHGWDWLIPNIRGRG